MLFWAYNYRRRDKYILYTINMCCDYEAQCYGTTPVRKQNSLHNYSLHLLKTSLMYTTVYIYTIIVYKVTLNTNAAKQYSIGNNV